MSQLEIFFYWCANKPIITSNKRSMMEYSDLDLLYLAICSSKAIFISCISLILLLWAVYLAVSTFKKIARMKIDYEEHINEMP